MQQISIVCIQNVEIPASENKTKVITTEYVLCLSSQSLLLITVVPIHFKEDYLFIWNPGRDETGILVPKGEVTYC